MTKNRYDWYNHLYKQNVIFDPLNIELKDYQALFFIGDVHEKFDLLIKLIDFHLFDENVDISDQYEITIVSLGDLFDKGDGPENGLKAFSFLKRMGSNIIYGNHEAKKVNKKDSTLPWEELQKLPRALSFYYPSTQLRLTALHAGVTPNHTWNDLKFNDDVIYVRNIDENGAMIPLVWSDINGKKELVPKKPNGINWHEKYDGRFGYIVSGHQIQRDGAAKFYKHSCNIDTGAYETGVLTGAFFNKNGFLKLIQTVSNGK